MRPCLPLLALLAGCPLPAKECPDASDCDTGDSASTVPDTDSGGPDDTDIGVDTDAPCDTGIAQLYFVGEFNTRAGEFLDARFGYGLYGRAIDDWACLMHGPMDDEGPAPEGCPDCEWSFDLGPITRSVAQGDLCADFGFSDGALDGHVDYAWGFAPTYAYDYNGSLVVAENALLLYYNDYWFLFAFNYAGRDTIFGDAEHLEIASPLTSGGSYLYYYYYPYPC